MSVARCLFQALFHLVLCHDVMALASRSCELSKGLWDWEGDTRKALCEISWYMGIIVVQCEAPKIAKFVY